MASSCDVHYNCSMQIPRHPCPICTDDTSEPCPLNTYVCNQCLCQARHYPSLFSCECPPYPIGIVVVTHLPGIKQVFIPKNAVQLFSTFWQARDYMLSLPVSTNHADYEINYTMVDWFAPRISSNLDPTLARSDDEREQQKTEMQTLLVVYPFCDDEICSPRVFSNLHLRGGWNEDNSLSGFISWYQLNYNATNADKKRITFKSVVRDTIFHSKSLCLIM